MRKTRLVAVVGSQGKTTTARAVSAALGLDDRLSGTVGNCFSFIALFLLHIRPDDEYAALEVGIDNKGQMKRYADLVRPDIAVVTSISSEHNTTFGNLGVTRTEKAEMVRALPPGGLAVLNGDDPNVLWMKTQTCARVVTCGLSPECDVRATNISFDWPRGMRFRLHAPGIERDTRTRLIGRVFIRAILEAAAVGLEAGRSIEAILSSLEDVQPTPGRLEPISLTSGAILLRDDFKSSLETIDAALDVLSEIPARRKIVVMGDVSEPPEKAGMIHHRLGARIGGMADKAIFLGSGNTCQEYAAGAAKVGLPRASIVKAGRNIERAVAAIQADLKEDDVVLIKGRTKQRLGRIALALMGREIGCDISYCPVINRIQCDRCPMLSRGWQGLRVEA